MIYKNLEGGDVCLEAKHVPCSEVVLGGKKDGQPNPISIFPALMQL